MADFRLLVAGMVHDHLWGMLPQFKKIKGVKIVGGADPNRPLRDKLKKEYGVTALFESYREMFRKVKADGVMVCGSNAGSVPIVEAAAAAGLDIMVEKPMAHTADGARRMLKAAKKHGVRLMINWPTAWNPALVKAMDLVAKGEIGHVFHARIHMAHQGPKEAGCTPYFYGWLYDKKLNGGGAIIDYCCYGAAIMATLWGKPQQAVGVAKTLAKPNFKVDDNAMITAIYPKRMILTQASWTQNPDYHDVLFLGVNGTLETSHGKLIRTHTNPKEFSHWGAERQNRKEIPLPKLASDRSNGPVHFVSCIRNRKPFVKLCRPEIGLIAQEILTAGVNSEKSGRRVRV